MAPTSPGPFHLGQFDARQVGRKRGDEDGFRAVRNCPWRRAGGEGLCRAVPAPATRSASSAHGRDCGCSRQHGRHGGFARRVVRRCARHRAPVRRPDRHAGRTWHSPAYTMRAIEQRVGGQLDRSRLFRTARLRLRTCARNRARRRCRRRRPCPLRRCDRRYGRWCGPRHRSAQPVAQHQLSPLPTTRSIQLNLSTSCGAMTRLRSYPRSGIAARMSDASACSRSA